MQQWSDPSNRLQTAILLLILSLAFGGTLPALASTSPEVGHAIRHDLSPSLAGLLEIHSRQPSEQADSVTQVQAGPRRPAALLRGGRRSPDGSDPVQLSQSALRAPALMLSVDGYDSTDNAGTTVPPAANGDVGGNFFVQYVNKGWLVLNKISGARIAGPFAGNTFWAGFGGPCQSENAGLPLVLYDRFAARWVFSQHVGSGFANGRQCFAISTGGSPLGPFHRYELVYSDSLFNDRPKLGIWVDEDGSASAYTLTSNDYVSSSGDFTGVSLAALEREVMLAGGGAPAMVRFRQLSSVEEVFFGVLPAHLTGPYPVPAGSCPRFLQQWDDEFFVLTGPTAPTDGYRLWQLCPDWATPAASTLSIPTLIDAGVDYDSELCGSLPCIPQPGTANLLETHADFTSYRASTRYWRDSTPALVTMLSHTVDVGSDRAGVRWVELDLIAESVLDQGTFAPADGENRWLPTAALDFARNLGIGFSIGSASTAPAIRYSGRAASDPAGTLQAEVSCVAGGGSQIVNPRWGDHASISVDPADDCTFYLTSQYLTTTSASSWSTRVCSFRFAGCFFADPIFADGFESGDLTSWTSSLP